VIKAVIFDLDGTLIHLPIDYERLIQEFRKIAHAESFHPLLEAVSKLDDVTRGRVFKIWDLAELTASAGMTDNQEGMKLHFSLRNRKRW
jgi:phosphoglycolate phosphatase-like HAD superfamily hydrolase